MIGNSITCTTDNQILLGSSVHTTLIPGNLSCNGLISGNVINTSGNLSCNGLFSANVINTSGDLSCYGLLSANVINTTGNVSCNGLISGNRLSTGSITFSETLNNISTTTFGFLAGVTSSVQSQINDSISNISTLQNKTIDILWTSGQINKTTIRNQCETYTLTFLNSINNISATTFSYLSGMSSNIQEQLNALKNTNPVGMVITYAGTSNILTGYLLCDGSSYHFQQYPYLYNAIGYTYGDAGNGYFKVPNYKGIFLRGAGQQNVLKPVIAGGGNAIFKNFQAPDLGKTVIDQNTSFSTNVYVDNITTGSKTVLTGSTISGSSGFNTTSVIGNVDFTSSFNAYNFGNQESHPVHTSVQYFIKY